MFDVQFNSHAAVMEVKTVKSVMSMSSARGPAGCSNEAETDYDTTAGP